MIAAPGDFADLFDEHYRTVGVVSLLPGGLPPTIEHDGRTFAYYAHTTAMGQRETRHPYREVSGPAKLVLVRP